ncbi:MAG: Rv1355c family protein [Acidobacteria bacterium]|nr:Rv1355c family protein [Acidobacteriota bacterium]
MAHSINRRYRYGSSFVDAESGVRFEGHHPAERPDLWKVYLDGAEGKYRSFGFEETLRRKELEVGTGVALFFLAYDPENRVVGGVRVHGPLESRFQAAIMGEMAASSEIEEIGTVIDKEVRLGVVELKGAWSEGESAVGHRLLMAISRCVVHALNWLGSEFGIAAIADRMLPIGEMSGGIRVGTTSVAFPDERYRTVAISYRRNLSYELATPENQLAYRREAEQLSRGPATPAGAVTGDTTQYHAWKPLVLDVTNRGPREVLRVLRENSSLQILDRFDEQRAQLDSLFDLKPSDVAGDGQRWVYYPWRRAVVRLLGPRSFDLLRLNRNRNKLTKKEQARLRDLRIGVIGASAGHSIAHVLAMEGIVGELRLADFDDIELHNLNRIPAGVMDLGVNKAVVLARRVAEVDPYLNVTTFTEGITQENLPRFIDGLDVVIEECDSLDIKFLVREAARERGIPVIMETSDRGVLDVERFDLEPHRPIFHGLLGEMSYEKLAGLTTEQKGPFVLQILGAQDVSARAAASALELGHTISGWPQLASEVTLGAATVAAAIRRFGLGGELPSGRVRFDIDEVLSGLAPVTVDHSFQQDLATPPPVDPPTTSQDPIDRIVDAARRAPSGGNVQPWRFESDGGEIRFYLVPERTSKMDVRHRASYLAIGAALFNARVAAAALHMVGQVQLFPESKSSLHVATLHLGEGMDPEIERLEPYLLSRSANRRIGHAVALDPAQLDMMSRAVEKEGALLRVATDRERIVRLGAMLAEADRMRFLIPEIHSQMMHEVRWPGHDSLEEGLDVRTLEMDPGSLGMMQLLGRADVMDNLREWRAGRVLGLRTQAAINSSSGVMMLTVPRVEPQWYVRAGAAMERLWLLGESLGLAMQPVIPLYMFANSEEELIELGGERRLHELSEQSERFREAWNISDNEAPSMVFRVFQAEAPSVHSIRLPLEHSLSRELDPEEIEIGVQSYGN